ncbi:FAD-dependent oxidoreductase [Streptomyces sp. NPDC098781]|uniref:FAD-dependent oxidoreductase n=1 Tax=Streptomyces sp. NPDC098781 TaxID=3366097 RepID=UPI003823E63C
MSILKTWEGLLMRVVVSGAGPVGLTAALLLAADGHQVTVYDRRPSAPHAGSLGVAQAHEGRREFLVRPPHILPSDVLRELHDELPDIARDLLGRDVWWQDFPSLVGGWRGTAPGESVPTALVVPQHVSEAVLSDAAARTPGVGIEPGNGVAALLTGAERIPSRPHVRGVLTDEGEAVFADLVVDAAGPESPMVRMLVEAGAPRPLDERQDIGYRLYARQFRAEEAPHGRPRWSLHPFDGLCAGVLYDGLRTWSVTLCANDEDAELYSLAQAPLWSRALELYAPHLRLPQGTPEPGVVTTPRRESRYRRFVVGGRPVATGVLSVGGAWAVSHPLIGLGLATGLTQALLLRTVLRGTGPRDAEETALRFDRLIETTLASVYRRAVAWGERSGAPAVEPTDQTIDGQNSPSADGSAKMSRALVDWLGRLEDVSRAAAGTRPSHDDMLSAVGTGPTLPCAQL